MVSGPVDIAELLNKTFGESFSLDDAPSPVIAPLPDHLHSIPPLCTVLFPTSLIRVHLKKLKNSKNVSPDGFSPFTLKLLGSGLCYPLSRLFEFCLGHEFVPPSWKLSFISPLFKQGSRSDPHNFRPISNTSIMCRVMERCISDSITAYLNTHNLLSKTQHGFRVGSSVVTNLAESTCDWTNIIDTHQSVDVAYIDLSKAFDSVVHSKLYAKLHSIGIQGSLLQWLYNYLSFRKQSVLIDNIHSSLIPVLSGVPQGSVLGPLLFSIFINDLPLFVMEKHDFSFPPLRLFADDIKVYRVVNNLHDALFLQSLLDSICSWCSINQLKINVQKCFILHLGHTNNHFIYGFHGNFIPKSELVKDLGVYMEPNLSYSRHISIICARARSRCSLYFKYFISRDLYSMKLFFVTYVRPLLEFASPVWNPISQTLINNLESVQKFFTNKIPTCTFLPYKRRLVSLNLDSLQKRRQVADLMFAYSIINGSTNTSLYPYLTFAPPSVTRGHDLQIIRPLFKLATSNQNLISRISSTWNKLPDSILSSQSKLSFKKKLSNFCTDPYRA